MLKDNCTGNILHAGEWFQLMMALYGYRKSPRLWQDHFVECVEQCKSVTMRRLKTEPSAFMEATGKEILLIVHYEVTYVGRKLRYVEHGYVWSGGDKLIETLLDETGLQRAK